MLEWSGYKNMELLYRGSRDGSKSSDFHSKCDNQGPTITLFKNEKGYIFGGFASISWKSNNSWQSVNDCFIFTLTNIHQTNPTKFNKNNNECIFSLSRSKIWTIFWEWSKYRLL